MKTQHLEHKFGGKITAITMIAHETHRGVASWHYIGNVEWTDGTACVGTRIQPYYVAFDGGVPDARAEYDLINKALTDYLATAGVWHDQKSKPDGRVYSWTPRTPSGSSTAGLTR